MTSKLPARTHEFKITHEWGEPVALAREGTGCLSVNTCLDCGCERRTLHLDTDEDAEDDGRHDGRGDEETLQWTAAAFRRLSNSTEKYVNDLLRDTGFDDLEQVQELLVKRYEGRIEEQEINLRLIGHFAHSKTRKQQRKVILALKQGLVCNRCDSRARSLDDLTEDHIIPRQQGGQSKLDNLQLLCRRCNEDKADGQPSDRDRSPFGTPTEPCRHRMTCREFDAFRASRSPSLPTGAGSV